MIREAVLNTTGKTIEESDIQDFEARLAGYLVLPEDEDYDEARKIWNAMIDKRPAIIVKCLGMHDVIHAVEFARKQALRVSVRGGGHNIAGTSLSDDGMVIDLSLMRDIKVDLDSRTVRAQPGCTLGDLDNETQKYGYVVPSGIVTETGIAGLTLGGGFGWLSRKYGYTCDNLISADIVTADGDFLRANNVENADLFWGIRGGGGNFGIVTSFEYQMHAVGPTVLGGLVLYPMEQAKEVVQFF
ncbi:MAG: FAD-binding oxidoreductase, partial [Dehalococcoidia bacterium]